MKGKTFVIVAGYWSTNIGNSFFQLGAEYLIRQAYPDSTILVLSDQPGYWKTGVKGNPENALLLLETLSFDYLVIQGPFLRPEYDRIWLETLKTLYRRGVKIIALAAGMMKYDKENVRKYRQWLSQTPPFMFITRDSETYQELHDIAEHSFDGIDIAFFVSDFFRASKMQGGPYLVYNFDKWPEPKIWTEQNTGSDLEADYSFNFENRRWYVRFPKLRRKLTRKSRVLQFVDSWLPANKVTAVDEFSIVRTDHRFNPVLFRNIYRSPNTLVSDIPQSYLTVYANSSLTLSNRVHACVATVAYGNSAMLFSDTPRSKLLARAGLDRITTEPQRLDFDYLLAEKQQLISFLRSIQLV